MNILKDFQQEADKEFDEKFGAKKIWVTPSKDNITTINDIKSFIHSRDGFLLKQIANKLETIKKPITSRFASMPKYYNQALDDIINLLTDYAK